MDTRPNIFSGDVERPTALTERQQQVATLACQGLRNREIAEKLGLTEGTIKIHLSATYEKLDVRSRTALMVLAHRGEQPFD